MSRTSDNQIQGGQPRHRRQHRYGEDPLPYEQDGQYGIETDNHSDEPNVGSEQEAFGYAGAHVEEIYAVEGQQHVERNFEDDDQSNGFGHRYDETRVEEVRYDRQAPYAGRGTYTWQGQHQYSQYAGVHEGYAGQVLAPQSQYTESQYDDQSESRNSRSSQDAAGEQCVSSFNVSHGNDANACKAILVPITQPEGPHSVV
jgi:hypothetical protein